MRILPLLPCLVCLVVLGCTSNAIPVTPGSNLALNGQPAQGAYFYNAYGDAAGSYAESHLGTDGKGFILVSSDDAKPASAFVTLNGSIAIRTPPPAPPAAETLDAASPAAAAIPTSPLTLATAAGTYSVLVNGGTLSLTVAADGTLSGSGNGISVSGALSGSSAMTGALPLQLTITGLAGFQGTFEGYALASSAIAPASLRLVGQNGSAVLDWMLL